VFCANSASKVYGPFFFFFGGNCDRNLIPGHSRKLVVPQNSRRFEWIFMQDCALPHFHFHHSTTLDRKRWTTRSCSSSVASQDLLLSRHFIVRFWCSTEVWLGSTWTLWDIGYALILWAFLGNAWVRPVSYKNILLKTFGLKTG
jgi:hypothetical protein